MREKAIGYLLLTVGVGTMVVSAFSVYSVFTGSWAPFALFNFPGVSVPLSTLVGPGLASSGQSNIDVLPAEALNATTNTLSHLFLMGFMVSLGYKLAMLGVNLVRPVVVRIEGKRLNGQTQEK